MSTTTITLKLPKIIVKRFERLGVDLESKIIELLIRDLQLDPSEEMLLHLELADKYFKEGRSLVDADAVQASEKLYKAAEEVIKALTIYYGLEEILNRVRGRGRWTIVDLEEAAQTISDKIGKWFYDAWDHAWILHVWGFHEAKLDRKAVEKRLPYIEKMVKEALRIVKENKQEKQ